MKNKGFKLSLLFVMVLAITLYVILILFPIFELIKFDRILLAKALIYSLGFLSLFIGIWLILPSSIRKMFFSTLGSIYSAERRLFRGRDIPYRTEFSYISWLLKPYPIKFKFIGILATTLGLIILFSLYTRGDLAILI